jgi:hypothetical protein
MNVAATFLFFAEGTFTTKYKLCDQQSSEHGNDSDSSNHNTLN